MASLYYAVSRKCNLRCKYCYLPEHNKSSTLEKELVLSAFKELVDKVLTESTPIDRFVFHGAEATLVGADCVSKMMDYAELKLGKTTFGIQTNGVDIKEFYTALVGRPIHFSVSLDVGEEEHDNQRGKGTFSKIIANLAELKRLGFSVSVLSVLTLHTASIEVIQKHKSLLDSLGIGFELKVVNLSPNNQISHNLGVTLGAQLWESGLYRHIQSIFKGICHNRGNACFFIECDYLGNVYSCNHEFGSGTSFGNWTNTSFEDLVYDRRTVYQDVPYDNDCVSCQWFMNCHGGCPITRVNKKADDCSIRLGILNELKCTNLSVKDIMLDRTLKNRSISHE